MSKGTQLDGGRELAVLAKQDPLQGSLVGRIIDAVNRLGRNIAASPTGELPAPSPVDSTQVQGTLSGNVLTVPGEILHWTHTHNVPIQRGVRYLTEIDTSPAFLSPHQIDTGSSRSGFVTLPTKNGSGATTDYYMRVTVQLPGSAPSRPTVYGGLGGPTVINMGGSTNMALLPSQAAGTARPGQGGQGLGPVAYRGAVGGPKRVL